MIAQAGAGAGEISAWHTMLPSGWICRLNPVTTAGSSGYQQGYQQVLRYNIFPYTNP